MKDYLRGFYLYVDDLERYHNRTYLTREEVEVWCDDYDFAVETCQYLLETFCRDRDELQPINSVKEALLDRIYQGKSLPEDVRGALGVYAMLLFFSGAPPGDVRREFSTLTWEEAHLFGLEESYWDVFGPHTRGTSTSNEDFRAASALLAEAGHVAVVPP